MIQTMDAEPRGRQRPNWWLWSYLIALVAIVTALTVLILPWAASAYHLERAGGELAGGSSIDSTSGAEAAERELRKAVEWYPDNAHAYRLLAQTYELQGDLAAKVEALARYVSLKPKDPLGYWELAAACEQLGVADLAQLDGKPCGADEKTRQTILARLWQQAGQSAADLIRAGDYLLQGKNLPEAKTFYQRALLLNPEAAAAWYGLAQVYVARNEHKEALAALARVVDLGSDIELIASAFDQQGQILAEAGRWAEAAQASGQAVALKPDQGHYHHRYGWYLHKAGRPLWEARAELEKAADLLPTSPWPRLRLADLAFAEQDYAQMLSYAKEAIEIRPDLASGWVLQGRALRFLEQFDEAERVLRHAIELAPANAAAHAELARALKQQGHLDQAIEEFERAVELAPRNVWFLRWLGDAYRAQGLTTEAAEAYRRVLVLDPENAAARQALEDLED
jgi:tetratricopeptide (TPR) repeat protein